MLRDLTGTYQCYGVDVIPNGTMSYRGLNETVMVEVACPHKALWQVFTTFSSGGVA